MCYNLGKMEKIALLDVPLKLKKVLPMAYNQKQKIYHELYERKIR